MADAGVTYELLIGSNTMSVGLKGLADPNKQRLSGVPFRIKQTTLYFE